MAEFDEILEDLRRLCEKHGVEVIIKSELSFKKLDGADSKPEETNTKTDPSGKDNRRKPAKR